MVHGRVDDGRGHRCHCRGYRGAKHHSAFGIDSLIELASAGLLIWRLSVELRHGRAFSESAERTASRIAGGLLFALAAYVVVAAGWGLWHGEGQAFSLPGLIVTALAIPVMYLLSKRKLSVAAQLGSRALSADAIEAVACGWLSFVVVLGLLAQLAIGAWWIDSVTSLAILWFLIKEGREAWTGEKCGADECCGWLNNRLRQQAGASTNSS